MAAIAGKLADAESMMALRDLMHRLGAGNLRHEGGFDDLCADVRSTYIANSSVAATEQADMILLIGTNPRVESPVFNARIRKAFLDGSSVALIGESEGAWGVWPGPQAWRVRRWTRPWV